MPHPGDMLICFFFMLFSEAPTAVIADPQIRAATELDQKGAELFSLGRYEEAASYQKRALSIWDKVSTTRPVALAAPHFNLAQIYLALGKVSAAEMEAGLARQFATPTDRARISALFAQINFLTRNYAEAEREVRAILPDLTGVVKATALNDLGMIRAARGDLGAGRGLIESALAMRERAGAASTPDHGRMLASLALICFLQGDRPAAISFYSQSIPILEATLGVDHPHVGVVLAEYSQALKKAGQKSEAKAAERRAKTILAASAHLPGVQTVDIRSLR